MGVFYKKNTKTHDEIRAQQTKFLGSLGVMLSYCLCGLK